MLDGIEHIVRLATGAFLDLSNRTRDRTVHSITILLGLVLLVASTARSVISDTSLEHTLNLEAGTTWVSDNSPRDSVVMAERPIIASIYTNRSTIGYPNSIDKLESLIERFGGDYLLINPELVWTTPRTLNLSEKAASSLMPYIRSRPNLYDEVYGNVEEKVYVFRVVPQ